jgi:hypothetical protein
MMSLPREGNEIAEGDGIPTMLPYHAEFSLVNITYVMIRTSCRCNVNAKMLADLEATHSANVAV